jgi:DNA mismatch repair protein MutS
VRDLERLLARVARPSAVPRDLGALRNSLAALPEVAAALAVFAGAAADGSTEESEVLVEPEHRSLPTALVAPVPLGELTALLEEGLIDDPPVIPRGSRGANETGYIREAFRADLDALREGAAKGREWIAGLEAREREKTGIATLKARYHPVHGYSLEVSKAQLARVPEHYERKQTLASVERFTTSELRDVESVVMGAHERAAALEREILESLRQETLAHAEAIRDAADAAAELDAFAALAEAARRERWVRPEVDAGTHIEIRAGRHPVVEAMLGSSGFVPNDTDLDPKDAQLLLLTGPNMSGKSTYLRQVALIVLLAQIGSFVPADSAKIGSVDRIFTRVGASDRLARGESTFMVEMREAADILDQASPRSLLILDEIGRGTSTFDGLSIAWAVAEYIHDTPRLAARTLFATHYHELTDLERSKPRVRNAHFEAREWNDEVVFLRKLVAGGASRSYGIQVAKLAGLPDSVIVRAREILANLESGERDIEGFPRLAIPVADNKDDTQLALFAPSPGRASEAEVIAELEALDPDQMTPMEALLALQDFSKRLGEGEKS